MPNSSSASVVVGPMEPMRHSSQRRQGRVLDALLAGDLREMIDLGRGGKQRDIEFAARRAAAQLRARGSGSSGSAY